MKKIQTIFLYFFGIFVFFILNSNSALALSSCSFRGHSCKIDPGITSLFKSLVSTFFEKIGSAPLLAKILIFFFITVIIGGIIFLLVKKIINKKYKLIFFLIILSIIILAIFFIKKGDIYYYEGNRYPNDSQLFKKVHLTSFMELINGYSKDKNNVYYSSIPYKHVKKRMLKADPNTFVVLKNNYAKDKNNVYYQLYKWQINDYSLIILENSDPDSFVILENNYSKDKNNVYYRNKIIENADPDNFDEKYMKYCDSDNDCTPVGCSCYCSGCGGFSYDDIVNKKYVNAWYNQEGCRPAELCSMTCCEPRKVVCENQLCSTVRIKSRRLW